MQVPTAPAALCRLMPLADSHPLTVVVGWGCSDGLVPSSQASMDTWRTIHSFGPNLAHMPVCMNGQIYNADSIVCLTEAVCHNWDLVGSTDPETPNRPALLYAGLRRASVPGVFGTQEEWHGLTYEQQNWQAPGHYVPGGDMT